MILHALVKRDQRRFEHKDYSLVDVDGDMPMLRICVWYVLCLAANAASNTLYTSNKYAQHT